VKGVGGSIKKIIPKLEERKTCSSKTECRGVIQRTMISGGYKKVSEKKNIVERQMTLTQSRKPGNEFLGGKKVGGERKNVRPILEIRGRPVDEKTYQILRT